MFMTVRVLGACLASLVALPAVAPGGGPVALADGPQQPSLVAGRGTSSMIDLTDAIVVVPTGLNQREKKAVAVLIEEVESRTGRRWGVQENWPTENRPVIVVGTATAFPDRAREILGGNRADSQKPRGSGSAPPLRPGLR